MQLGVIADDITGGTDVAAGLSELGFHVIQTVGVPSATPPDADVVVISAKIRTIRADDAVRVAEQAARMLRASGAPTIFFKYCSTFDSTDAGNIGPIAERLIDLLDAPYTIACPTYPEQLRTVYQGHLFVGDRLLSESSMRNHPLTPMTDPDLRRVLGRQCRRPVGHVPLAVVETGAAGTRGALDVLAEQGTRLAIVDAQSSAHLATIAEAVEPLPLITGAAGLSRAWGRHRLGDRAARFAPTARRTSAKPAIVLSGSCSTATLAQVMHFAETVPARAVDPAILSQGPAAVTSLIDWAAEQLATGDAMLYSSASPEAVRAVQTRYGQANAAELVESAFRAIVRALADLGVRNFVVAGGETSGAILDALGIQAIAFGDTIVTGVPWTHSVQPEGFNLALKSGNFGGPDFFTRALTVLRNPR